MRKLVAIAAKTAVAARIAAAIPLNSLSRVAEHLIEDALPFELRYQSGAARNVVVEHDRGLARIIAIGSYCDGILARHP